MPAQFSIVIPTLDRKDMLSEALASVQAQQVPDVEIIVVDGGSVDGTREMLQARPGIILLQDTGRGVYDALNQGLSAATGEIVGVLNSDDHYAPGTFAAVGRTFAANPSADSVCGACVLEENGRVQAVVDNDRDKTLATARTVFIGNSIFNARFFRRKALARIGPFSLDYPYVADRDWLARVYTLGLITIPIKQRTYSYRKHAGSLTFSGDPVRGLAIRQDLLKLARTWHDRSPTVGDIRRVTPLVEGRCLAVLIGDALRRGDVASALRLIFRNDGGFSLAPLGALASTAVDVAIQRSRARLRRLLR